MATSTRALVAVGLTGSFIGLFWLFGAVAILGLYPFTFSVFGFVLCLVFFVPSLWILRRAKREMRAADFEGRRQ